MTQEILRTPFGGAFTIHDGTWGRYLLKCRDPEATIEDVTKEQLNHFELKEGIHRIPQEIWTPWVDLCFHYVHKVPREMEVSVRFLRSETDHSQYMAIVPRQSVTKASVDADDFNDSCNLLTGEAITSYPPDGWIPIGSTHSHNTMSAFFSPTDDSSQMSDPGIHFTVGDINTKTMEYKVAASVVAHGRRFIVNFNHLIDAAYKEDASFHPNVLEYVDITTPAITPYSKWMSRNLLPAKAGTLKEYSSMEEFWAETYGGSWAQDEQGDQEITHTNFQVGDTIVSKTGLGSRAEITCVHKGSYDLRYTDSGHKGNISKEIASRYVIIPSEHQNAEQIESLENIWTDKHGIQSSKITHTNYNWAPDDLNDFYDVDSLRDPFHYDDNPIFNGTKTGFSLHPLTDFVNDYVTENFHDTDALDNLKAELSSLIATIDLVIQS
jgi:hypothetical protein